MNQHQNILKSLSKVYSISEIFRYIQRKRHFALFSAGISVGIFIGIGVLSFKNIIFSTKSRSKMATQTSANAPTMYRLIDYTLQLLGSYLPSSLVSSPYDLDPAAATQKFIHDFEANYGNVHPNFLEGTYQQAFSKSKTDFKFVVIYIHSTLHSDSAEFCRRTLANELIADFFNEHFLCFGADVRSSEGLKLVTMLGCSTFPFLAVITNNSVGGVTIVDRIEGPIAVEDLMSRLTNVLETHGQMLTAARLEQEERVFDRRLREEQEVAFQQSLAEDQERDRILEEEQRRLREEREEQEREEQMLVHRQRERERRREHLLNNLPAEPPADDRTATKLVIRMPDGSRFQRRFSSSESVQTVYDYIDSQQSAFTSDGYQLVMSYPRKVFADRQISIEEAGLAPQASLFVEEL